jgi:hypothetical protein
MVGAPRAEAPTALDEREGRVLAQVPANDCPQHSPVFRLSLGHHRTRPHANCLCFKVLNRGVCRTRQIPRRTVNRMQLGHAAEREVLSPMLAPYASKSPRTAIGLLSHGVLADSTPRGALGQRVLLSRLISVDFLQHWALVRTELVFRPAGELVSVRQEALSRVFALSTGFPPASGVPCT